MHKYKDDVIRVRGWFLILEKWSQYLEEFDAAVIRLNSREYDSSAYIVLVSKLIEEQWKDADKKQVAQAFLDLSRICCDVGDYYSSAGRPEFTRAIQMRAVEAPCDYGVCNDIILSDLLFNYYLSEARVRLKDSNVDGIVKLLLALKSSHSPNRKRQLKAVMCNLAQYASCEVMDQLQVEFPSVLG